MPHTTATAAAVRDAEVAAVADTIQVAYQVAAASDAPLTALAHLAGRLGVDLPDTRAEAPR